ncbi:TolC family outer membrane protein [Pseudoblastomonas halimionae]|uniref:TolC family outer membrane protein n=1 Tax=Alteriqipengyuania halimionae TaxID=1926630 RepID=A0A6I4U607_9SPHN|nr:TolC family outer membrane protein [Alteriqipengyuania halimionae]MXP10824.1 TolC family outer membrane protein [Alteriqipengyuania halimionae]
MRSGFATILLIGTALAATPAHADTLREALAKAYSNNPTLLAARADQRATDENVAIQRAETRPSASASVDYSEFLIPQSDSPFAPSRSVQGSVQLGVPIYTGGATRNAIRAAETRVDAGQADLRGTESELFTQVVAAYMDVIQNEAITSLSLNNVDVLQVNLEATSDRFEIGDLTRTDVAQSQSRLALARGDLRSAQSNLIGARERYIQLVGDAPDDLQPPPPLPNLPEDVNEAVDVALQANPDILAAKERARAAGFDIDVAGAGRLPTLSAFIGQGYNNYLGSLGGAVVTDPTDPNPDLVPQAQVQTSTTVGLRASIPIYSGGRVAAQERQAQARASAALEREIAVERGVVQQVRAAFASWRAASAIVEETQVAVEAAELGLEGVRAENTVGNRTILDILNAQQELLSARVQLVTARRNEYVAGFSLLAAMGRAEARDLNLDIGGPLYDPELNFERVGGKWWDWDRDPDPEAEGTRTVDTPSQTGAVSPDM